MIRDRQILVSFRSDEETAAAVLNALTVTANALWQPTEASAHELFTLGAEAVVLAAQLEREREQAAA